MNDKLSTKDRLVKLMGANDKLSTKDRLVLLMRELHETALLYEAAGYRSDELWDAWRHIIRTVDDVAEELSIPE